MLLLGIVPEEMKVANSMFSQQFLTAKIYEELQKLHNISIEYHDCRFVPEEIPQCDVILFIGYFDNWYKLDLQKIKQKTNAKKIVSFLELPIKESDWSFCFRGSNRINETVFNPPCAKDFYKKIDKEPNSILIDHYWEDYLGTEKDWTYRIEDWLDEVKGQYKIYRLIRFKDEIKHIRDFETPILYSKFFEYLEKTDKIQNFILTHQECYPFGVIDMAVRKTRVLTPPQFVLDELECRLGLIPFNDKTQLLKALQRPVEGYWNTVDELCDDFSFIAKKMDEKLQGILSNA
jgi:hypothetical protein